jgi:hypothetical protein
MRTSHLVAAALCAATIAPPAALAAPPKTATIVEGRSMAGVSLRTSAPRNADNDRVTSGPLKPWGKVVEFCFEGSNCLWKVPGGGTVEAILNPTSSKVQRMNTTAPGWRTGKGIRHTSTVTALRAAYGTLLLRRNTCGLNGFGGDNHGYVLNTRVGGERRFTFFELNAALTRVDRVWIGRGRVPSGTGC